MKPWLKTLYENTNKKVGHLGSERYLLIVLLYIFFGLFHGILFLSNHPHPMHIHTLIFCYAFPTFLLVMMFSVLSFKGIVEKLIIRFLRNEGLIIKSIGKRDNRTQVNIEYKYRETQGQLSINLWGSQQLSDFLKSNDFKEITKVNKFLQRCQ